MTGSKYYLVSGVVGNAGKPVKIYSITAIAGSTSTGITVLHNGTGTGDPKYARILYTVALHSTTINFEGGMLFPDGCYVNKSADIASFVVCYEAIV